MKKRILFILGLIVVFGSVIHAQEAITEEAYLKADSLIWLNLEKQQNILYQREDLSRTQKDSIAHAVLEKALAQNIELAIKYATVPSGLRRLYMVRLDLPKDTLEKVLKSLSIEMQESFYGKNIRAHLETGQIEKGDFIQTFPCTQENGEKFNWTITEGKQLLLLYGGLGCMGENGRQYLKQLYETTSRQDFLILVYWPCSSLQKLKELKQNYPCDYMFISDFQQDGSPMKIKYGAQSTPTCFLTDKQHRVVVKCTGLHPELFAPYLPMATSQDSVPYLVIIDGKESSLEAMSQLSPAIIKSIEIFKGEEAVALYTEKGRNGVVKITLISNERKRERAVKKWKKRMEKKEKTSPTDPKTEIRIQ